MNISHLDEEQQRQRLKQLRIDHRALDQQIIACSEGRQVDQFEIRRLKKRKLALKDAIMKLESQIIPDLNA
ncbi:MAG: YdcH family protein [Pseudomonadales bacterium]|nr:YdcH family protein [Pseudomonadales bacterium]